MFRKLFMILVLPVLIGVAGCVSLLTPKVEQEVAQLKSGSYGLDQSHAALLFKVQHLGLSTYVGRFNTLDASLEFNPGKLAETRLTALVDMASIDINDESLAKRIRGPQWFNVGKYPQAKFSTLEVKPLSENRFGFIGQLDWRGIIKPITLTVTFHGGANNILTGKYTLGFSAEGHFNRSDFGLDAYLPLVGDRIELEGHAEFQKN